MYSYITQYGIKELPLRVNPCTSVYFIAKSANFSDFFFQGRIYYVYFQYMIEMKSDICMQIWDTPLNIFLGKGWPQK